MAKKKLKKKTGARATGRKAAAKKKAATKKKTTRTKAVAKKKAATKKKTAKKKTTRRKASAKKTSKKKAMKRARAHSSLTPGVLKKKFPAGRFDFASTKELTPLNDIIGQDRALKALRMGVRLHSSGYNIYVSGMAGTGKLSTVNRLLDQIRPDCPALRDFVYVYNFEKSNEPILIEFPAGQGKEFASEMDRVLQMIREELPKILHGEGILEQKELLAKPFLDQQKELLTNFEKDLKSAGFELTQVRIGNMVRPEIVIPIGEEQYPFEQLAMMVEVGQMELAEGIDLEALREGYETFRKQMKKIMKESRRLSETMMKRLENLDREIVNFLIGDTLEELIEKYESHEKIVTYLQAYKENVLEYVPELKALAEEMEGGELPAHADPIIPYHANLILDNSRTKKCPVVLESNPTYNSVFGSIERRILPNGQAITDFTKITAGSLLQADGGYLVLNAADALSEPGFWKTLKRILVHKQLVIQGIEGLIQLSTVNLKPEPIHVKVTIILIGSAELYFMLNRFDEDFRKIFKVRADFDNNMPVGKQTVEHYGRFVAQMSEREKTLPFVAPAVAKLLEFGVRLAGRQDKVSTRFGDIADIVRESSFWAEHHEQKSVDVKAVEHTLKERDERSNLIEEKVRERLRTGVVLLEAEGGRVGQVNGLAVLTYGEHRFGIPSRITASVARGKAGIINIEREAHLSGSSHDKGMLILSGFLREQFTQEINLSLTASICFEQSYGGVDGDSASSTELYVLLSAIGEIPLRQEIAITGSVNQKGDIQAIGGVNEKIEGFYKFCKERGLTGKQGVMIPAANVADLMLHDEVVEAVRKKKFRVYAIERIEQGIEILTGVSAGTRRKNGRFPKNTVFGAVEERLRVLDTEPPRVMKKVVKKKARRRKKTTRR
ncbi:MAG: AAA family ATPase [Gemmatimonadetes bacterium]|nr:AAA family ATPase [Gemmatimonadota bacterium]